MSVLPSFVRRLGRALALCALVAFGGAPAHAALFGSAAQDLQAEARAAAAAGKRLALFLTQPNCPGCLEMQRTVFTDRQVQSSIRAAFRDVQLDVSGSESMIDPAGRTLEPAQFARQLHAVGTPSFAFFDGRGQVLYRYTGTLDALGLRRLATFVAREEYEQRPFVAPQRSPLAAPLRAEPPDTRLPQRPDFALAATDGRVVRPASFRGRVIALAVGYLRCPDVCPTTLAELKSAVERLPTRQRQQVQVLFATIDPERDGPDGLAEYVAAFRPRGGRPILGLRGDAAQTAALVRTLQLVVEKHANGEQDYSVDHTAGVFLFDRAGRLAGFSPYTAIADTLALDFATLVGDAARGRR